ncbi:MAG: HlyD family efflux transporter periplasmic adaptor subunit [Candidatus Brocadiia bacterium]
MRTEQQRQRDGIPQGSGDAELPVLGLIESLERACGPETAPEEFARELLSAFTTLAEGVHGVFWSANREAGELEAAAELSPGLSEEAAEQLRAPLHDLAAGAMRQEIIRYRSVAEPADPVLTGRSFVALAFPVRREDEVSGCVTIVVNRENTILSGAGIALLRMLANFSVLDSEARRAARFESFYRSLSGAWDTIGELLAFEKPRQMAQVLADRARAALGARRVSVGFVKGEDVKVAAISGEDILDKRSNVVRQVQAAQREVVISGEPALYRASADAEERAELVTRYPQQERLAAAGDVDAVYSVPLRKDDELVAVMTAELEEGDFGEDTRNVVDVTAGQVGPLLHLARQNERGLLRRGWDTLVGAVEWVFGEEHPWRKVIAVGVLLLVAFGIFGRVDFNVSGSCRLVPSFRRVYAAPFDTTIQAAPVRPGDTVEEGEPLVIFDQRDLEVRLREARSKRTSVEKEMSTYLVQEGKMAQYAEARARRDALEAEIELLQRQLERTTLRAEFPGIVLEGDLSQDIGRPVQMGEKLIEVAPLDEFVLEVSVDQGDVSYVEPGLEGEFTTKAKPDMEIPFQVSKVRPTPEVREGASVYIAEAPVPNRGELLRPGMEGAAKVKVGRRNVTWTVTRKLVNWIRMHVWW